MIRYDRKGGRTIELFLPFELDGKEIKEIFFPPIRFDHTLRWQQGEWKSSLNFAADVAGIDVRVLRNLAYPDTDRVLAIFVDMLPPEIRSLFGQLSEDRPALTPQSPPSEGAPLPAAEPLRGNGQARVPPPFDPDNPKPFDMDLPADQQAYTQQERDALGLGVDLNG